MIKLINILKEAFADDYPKNKYIELTGNEAFKYSDDIFDLIIKSYATKGGNPKLQNKEDIKNLSFWILKDIDLDPEADVTIGGKKTKHGNKLAMGGQDGTDNAKIEFISKLKKLLDTGGFYAELDKDLAQKIGVEFINDKNIVKKVINKKDIEFNEDGSYTRSIEGNIFTKVLVGNPLEASNSNLEK
jgi:hypothetical protein